MQKKKYLLTECFIFTVIVIENRSTNIKKYIIFCTFDMQYVVMHVYLYFGFEYKSRFEVVFLQQSYMSYYCTSSKISQLD